MNFFAGITEAIWSIPGVMAVEDMGEDGFEGLCVLFETPVVHVSQLSALYDIFEEVEMDMLDGYLCAWVYYDNMKETV